MTRPRSPRFRLPPTGFGKQAWCTHIAPESTYLNEDSSNEELASMLAGFKSFGHAIKQLNQQIWFEKTIRTTPTPSSPPSKIITQSDPSLSTPRNNIYHLSGHPRPARYLCKGRPVFWGIDKQDRVVEGLGVLAEDGGGIRRRPVEKHEPIYTTITKRLTRFAF
ncbi:hypothetical protein ARMGADRAFT_1083150 [Armillaria gallica]|uniref:Uncharacterized protein n=1 Tax=Armillaria gallica TaxID=47427 RepID=A0A2H3DFS7_ARMGA|nr:hypothetical protein ARMGADRAFT_1083150 [Armillaria gallica]